MNYPCSTPPYSNLTPPPQRSSVSPIPHSQRTGNTLTVQRLQPRLHSQSPPQQIIDHQWQAITSPTSAHNGYPSTEQRAAVVIVRGVPIPTILAWLDSFRSSLHSGDSFGLSQLPDIQYLAVSTLSVCPDHLVQTWLNEDRQLGSINTPQASYASNNFSHGSMAFDSFAQSPSSFGGSQAHVTQRKTWDEMPYNLSRGTFVGVQSSSTAASKEYDRWCFICENPRRHETRGGFIRHMKEHYTVYYCIPEAPVQYSEDGPLCAVCRISDPHPKHLNTHNDPSCIGKKYKRKGGLAKHLIDKHGVHQTSRRIKQSAYTVDQEFFACGFCITCLDSLDKLVHHVDAEHYKSLANIRDWDPNKVIQGLLSQPKVNEYWQKFLAANPRLHQSRLEWNPTRVKILQKRLERSQEPANVLCEAAIKEFNYQSGQHGHMSLLPLPNFRDLNSPPHNPNEPEHASSPMPSTSDPESTVHHSQMVPPTLKSQPFLSGWDDSNNSDGDGVSRDLAPPQVGLETRGSPTNATHQYVDRLAQPFFSPVSDQNFMQHRHQTYPFVNISTSGAWPALAGQRGILPNARLSEVDAPCDGSTHPQTRPIVGDHVQAAHIHTGWHFPASQAQSASSLSSPGRDLSPLGHFNDISTPLSPDLATNTLHREMRDHNSTDINIAFNNQQSFTQGRGCWRRQGRYR